MGHVWLRFKGQDHTNYFIDPTYGQINRRLNRIVIDEANHEQQYFHYDREPEIITERFKKFITHCPTTGFMPLSNDRIFMYKKVK